MFTELAGVAVPGENPEKNKSYSELLDSTVQILGQKLLDQPPRWANAYNPENDSQEMYESRWVINPKLFLTPGVQRDQEVAQYSDANPLGHLHVTGLTARDYMLYNRDLSNAQLLSLVCYFHDYHEKEVGDRVVKDSAFKLEELYHIVNSTASDLFLELAKNSTEVSNNPRDLLSRVSSLTDDFIKVFLQEEKLQRKYGITKEKIEHQFRNDPNMLRIIEDSFSNLKYQKVCEDYENIHEITFLLASLSCNANSIAEKALRYEALTRVITRMQTPSDYTLAFLEKNRSLILKVLEDGANPLVKFVLEKSKDREFIDPSQVNLNF